MNSAWVKPKPGGILRKPRSEGGGFLEPDGEKVHLTSFWRRRIKAGDVLVIPPDAKDIRHPLEQTVLPPAKDTGSKPETKALRKAGSNP